MSDKEYYLIATKEFEEGNIDEFLWAKVMTLAEGDEVKAKYKYIKLRTEELREELGELIKIQKKEKRRERLSLKTLTKAVDGVVGLVIFIYLAVSTYFIVADEFLAAGEETDLFIILFLLIFVTPIVSVFLMSFILNAIFKPSNAIEFHKKFILTLTSIGAASIAMTMYFTS